MFNKDKKQSIKFIFLLQQVETNNPLRSLIKPQLLELVETLHLPQQIREYIEDDHIKGCLLFLHEWVNDETDN